MTVSRGIYRIDNAGVPVAMDLYNGSSDDGTEITGWAYDDGLNAHRLWLLEPVDGQADTFTVRSLCAGTYMDLSNGSSDNQTPIFGWHRTGQNQEWIIKHSADGSSYKMKNRKSGTFADLYNGGSDNGTPIYGWEGSFDDSNSHQCWYFKRMSLSSADVLTVVLNNPHIAPNFRPYQVDGEYLILPPSVLRTIWGSTGLDTDNQLWRPQIFDCDDFALIMKAAVAKWGNDNWKADNFAVFCGLMLGVDNQNPPNGHAYNFTISDDHSQVVFFEPQTGDFMDDIGYDAVLSYV